MSRGILPIEYLTSSLNDEDWYNTLNDNLTASFSTGDPVNLGDIGGFTLIYGKLEIDPKLGRLVPLNIMSNRGDRGRIHVSSEGATDPHFEIAQLSQFSVSNALYYEPWPKTKLGNSKLANVVPRPLKNHIPRPNWRRHVSGFCPTIPTIGPFRKKPICFLRPRSVSSATQSSFRL